MRPNRTTAPSIAGVLFLSCAVALAADPPGWSKNWPQFRGPSGNGTTAADADPPAKFNLAKDLRYRTKVPKKGDSSPIIWGSRIYLTGGDTSIMAFDRETGRLQWNAMLKVPAADEPDDEEPIPMGKTAGGAAPTPVTDGKFVYAFFGNGVLGCVDSSGKQVWARRLVAGKPKNTYGFGASPILYGDLLIQVVDRGANPRAKESFVVAVRTKDGTEAWRKERPVSSCWTTPLVVRGPAGDVLVTTAPPLVIAYDPQTGRQLWQAEGTSNGELSASPVQCGDGVVAVTGKEGLMALKVGGKGDVTKSGLVWTSEVTPPNVSSPVGSDGRCYLLADEALTCFDAATGKERWNLDVKGEFWASPVLAKDRIYAINRDGVLFVVSTDGKPLDKVELGSGVEATPAIVQGRIYIRTADTLLCLGRP